MKTFEGLKDGMTIHNDIDGDMVVCHTDAFNEDGKQEMCFHDGRNVWRGCQFNPNEWEVVEEQFEGGKTRCSMNKDS